MGKRKATKIEPTVHDHYSAVVDMHASMMGFLAGSTLTGIELEHFMSALEECRALVEYYRAETVKADSSFR
jgi:hypothetical protein